ncbi:MAG: D-alanyl-D-alanine carboxypeptidase [Clostridia bacterium]|nr:D-alanyl-D-alanine carboxypeptidase [Clostridia bacterium]
MKKFLLLLLSVALTGALLAVNVKSTKGYCLESEAAASYVMDYATKTRVFAVNETKRLPIASMTKIMLLDLVFDSVEKGTLKMDEVVTVSKTASGMGGSQVFLQADKGYVVKDLIKSVIIASANDASVALAERLYGSESACVAAMNARAKSLGLNDTLFSNCTGLPKPTQYSCAKDVAEMLYALIGHEGYFEFSSVWLDELTHPDGQKTTLTNTNKLVRFYAGCDGGKTGYTSEAGFCLAATAKRGGMRVISVAIGEKESKKRFADVSYGFDQVFDNYVQKIVVDKDYGQKQAAFVAGGKTDVVYAEPKETVYAFMKKTDDTPFEVRHFLNGDLSAPIAKGEEIGSVTVYKDGVEYKKVPLVAAEAVERRSYSDVVRRYSGEW